MPDPLPESGQISIFQIAEFYEGGSEESFFTGPCF